MIGIRANYPKTRIKIYSRIRPSAITKKKVKYTKSLANKQGASDGMFAQTQNT